MQDSTYKLRLRAFQISCHTYLRQKEEAKKLLKQYPDLSNYVSVNEEGQMNLVLPKRRNDYTVPYTTIILYKLILEDLFSVETVLNKISEKNDLSMVDLITNVFINGVNQQEAGQKLNLSRRQVQLRIHKIMKDILEDNQNG